MRRLAAIALASLLVAACGSSAATGSPVAPGSQVPAASTAAGTSPAASDGSAAASPAPGGSAAPGGSTAPAGDPVACRKLNDAIGTIDLYTQLLSQVDASNWTDLTGPSSPVDFKLSTLQAAIATIATYPDASELTANVKEVARLAAAALKDPAPFTSGSRVGVQLSDTVQKLFVPIGVAMTQLRERQGCPVQ